MLPKVLELRRRLETWLTIRSAIRSRPASASARTSSQVPSRGIGLRVVDRIEAGVGAVDRPVERQQVRAAEQALERSIEQILEFAKSSAGEAVDVGDELDLISHRPADSLLQGPVRDRAVTAGHQSADAIREGGDFGHGPVPAESVHERGSESVAGADRIDDVHRV